MAEADGVELLLRCLVCGRRGHTEGREREMTQPGMPAVFVHGLWLHASSWAGYMPAAECGVTRHSCHHVRP